MKNFLCLFIFVLVACKQPNEEPSTAPRDWTLEDIPTMNFDDFEPFLNRQSEKVQIINFWATWCAPCVEEMPYFEILAEKYKRQVDLKFISLDMPEHKASKVLNFANKNRIQNDIVLLDDTRSHYWIPKVDKEWSGAIPATLIYHQNKKHFYEKPFTQEELEDEINKFIN